VGFFAVMDEGQADIHKLADHAGVFLNLASVGLDLPSTFGDLFVVLLG
jgi:hypothetical protein